MSAASRTLSEHASKELLGRFGVPVCRELLAADPDAAAGAAETIGLPVALKLCGEKLAHKTERELVRLGLRDAEAVRSAARDLLMRARPEDGAVELIVAEMVQLCR